MIPSCFNYKGHVIYTDGRVYENYVLLGQYKTIAAAKAQATRNHKRIFGSWIPVLMA
jgi:hypothetical protein